MRYPLEEEKVFLGIDIGSSSSKAVILNEQKKILGKAVINTGAGTQGPEKAVSAVLQEAGISREQVKASVVTGYGRIAYDKADKQITEISCHAKGAIHLMPNARTVIDIGGQDAKVIRLDENGRVENFVMNDKCAAGTGRFLEVMARILDCGIEGLSSLSKNATEEIIISNTCTVFAESEVISQLAAGAKRENVARGVHKAVAKRVAGLGSRMGLVPDIIMTGGVALNKGVVSALEQEIGKKITIVSDPQLVGAMGAALYALDMASKSR
ncbi:MAG: acyl-CoA dehydratase activase [Thermodesulfobacteriota bacterium]|jgi:predicted CoA-substrate-specific enzyme activase